LRTRVAVCENNANTQKNKIERIAMFHKEAICLKIKNRTILIILLSNNE